MGSIEIIKRLTTAQTVPSIKSQPAKGTQIKLSDQNYGQRLVYKMKSYS